MKKLFKFSDNFHGSGSIYFSWQKGQNAKYLVTTGNDQLVNLHDRYGNTIDSFSLNGICSGLEWNRNGDLLATITDRSSVVKLWDSVNQRTINVDFQVKESLNLILWSVSMPNLLAVTTVKGNLLIYDHNTSRRIPIIGKHSKKIVSGCWTNQNLLALVCEDRYLSISDESGDTVFQTNLKSKGSLVKSSMGPIEFSNLKNETGQTLIESYCVSVVLNRKQIILLPFNSLDQPFVLSFEERYEEIFDYYWKSNGQLLIAFTSGFIINVQTTGNQLGQELVFVKVFPDTIASLNLCESTGSLAVIHKNVIKLLNANSLEHIENVHVVEDEQELEWLEWSTNGQMLAVSSSVGNLNVFLVKLPIVSCAHHTKVAYLSTLLEITFIDIEHEKLDSRERNRIQLDLEPTLMSMGKAHLAACMNNRAYFYELYPLHHSHALVVKEREYSSIVKHMCMNDQYAAVLFTDNKAILHRIPQLEDFEDGDQANKEFYQVDTKLTIFCIELTNNFFIWCTDSGILEFFSIEEWSIVSVHRHVSAIRMICPDYMGLRILLVDERNEAYVFDATNEQLTGVESHEKEETDLSFNYEELITDRIVVGQRNHTQAWPMHVSKLLWDSVDHSMFAVVGRKQCVIYYYVAKSVQGSFVQLVGKSSVEEKPLLIYDGSIYYQSSTGNLTFSRLETHNYSKLLTRSSNSKQEKMSSSSANLKQMFENLLKLRRHADCWMMCKNLNKTDFWLQYIDCCLHDLNMGEAIRIARYIGHAGIVWSLKSIQSIEELNLLSGHVAMYLRWFDLAEKWYLKSSQPTCALKLRLDLMQWSTCLVLARRLATDQLPFIHKQQANELEFEENYQLALDHYQDALIEGVEREQIDKHNQECLAGISRCLIKCGDSKKGVQIAMKLNDFDLVARSATVCEESNLFNEAANLYERTGQHENACLFYLKTRNLNKVKELLHQSGEMSNAKTILVQYGNLQEQEGKFTEAFRAYEEAGQQIDCVRLLLDKMNRPQEAVRLVKQQRLASSSTEACLLIAKHFQQTSDYESAIEFLVYSGKLEEAFELALQESQMNLYTNALLQILESNTQSIGLGDLNKFQKYEKRLIKQLQRVAVYYEEEHNLLKSGKFYCLAGQHGKGISNLLKAHQTVKSFKQNDGEEDPLKLAIEFACKSNDEQSIQQVIEVLVNELESGSQTDFQYLFKLYMCSGQYRDATKTALLLAKEEQCNGNYDHAHGLLVGMATSLLANKLKIPFELLSALHLVHCYKLAKFYLKHEQLDTSCELLCKVSNSISKFPKHAAQILSTAVVQCLKLNKQTQAIHFSTILLQNSVYLEQLDAKFRRKIETLIRKSASAARKSVTDSLQIEENACPFCRSAVPKLQLTCTSCRCCIPFSILTGYHLTDDDCFQCNSCNLPFTHKEFVGFLEIPENHTCPACGHKFEQSTTVKMDSLAIVA